MEDEFELELASGIISFYFLKLAIPKLEILFVPGLLLCSGLIFFSSLFFKSVRLSIALENVISRGSADLDLGVNKSLTVFLKRAFVPMSL